MAHDWNVQGGFLDPEQETDQRSMTTNALRSPRNTALPYDNMADIQEQEYHPADSDGEDGFMDDISDADAQSLMEPAISRAATRLTSPTTPAAEKVAAMDDLEGGGYFDENESDGEITPPAAPSSPEVPKSPEVPGRLPKHLRNGLSLGQLPMTNPTDEGFPSPWVAGSKPIVVVRPGEGRSALKEALTAARPRSSSWSSDAFKRFLPSIPKSGSFIPSTSFFSSSGDQKSRSRGFTTSGTPTSTSPSPMATPTQTGFAQRPSPKATNSDDNNDPSATPKASSLRRSASDESLLYHSLSRASSLGDDSRFENHHEMVNSRGKAIRDSLQDRSSFRLPAMPSMPSMPRVPSFTLAMNFAFSLSNNTSPVKWKGDADSMQDILPGNMKKRSTVPNPIITPGLIGAAPSRPEAARQVLPDIDGTNWTFLDRAMEDLTGDVVIMGGYRGSILRSTKTNQQLWAPIKVGLNIRKVNMEVGLEPEDEERMEETIFPSGMLQHVGPVDISRRLFKRLRSCENAKNGSLRIWDYGYDWRLSPHLISKKLIMFMQTLPSNQPHSPPNEKGALVIAHSLGGLIARHAVNQRPELFSGIVYAGVPKSCVNILGPIRNGDAVLLSSRVLTAQVNFTIRSTFALLPLDGYCFIDKNRKDVYPVDFFNADDWIKYRFSPCTDAPLPPKGRPTGSLANILNGSLTNLTLPRKMSLNSGTRRSPGASSSNLISSAESQPAPSPSLPVRVANAVHEAEGTDRTLAPQMGNLSNPVNRGQNINSSVSTAVTIPRDDAIAYLRRTLAETKKFKMELLYDPELGDAGLYPPAALIYGKSTPTVYAARVDGRDGIPCSDCYDDLAFASGDGVCLAKEAMLPEGYSCVRGGRISSDRGHVTLLGDLNAVGKAILAVRKGRAKGIGLSLQV